MTLALQHTILSIGVGMLVSRLPLLSVASLHNGLSDCHTSSTAQGGCGSFKNRKPIGEIGCCESGMAERSH